MNKAVVRNIQVSEKAIKVPKSAVGIVHPIAAPLKNCIYPRGKSFFSLVRADLEVCMV